MEKATSTGGLFVHLVPILKKYQRYFIAGVVVTIISNILILVNPYLLKLVFDAIKSAEGKGLPEIVYKLCVLMVVLAIIAGVFHFFMRRLIIWASRKAEYDLRNKMFEKWLVLDPGYYDNVRTGDLMAHATNDIEAVRMMTGPAVMHILNTVVSSVTALSFMITLSPQLTLYTLIPLLVLAVGVHRIGTTVHKRFTKIQEHFSFMTSQVQENLAGIRVIKAYGRENNEIERFSGTSRQYADLNMDMIKIMGFMRPLIFFIAGVVILIILFAGGQQVIDSRITLGTLVAFMGYMSYLIWPMMALGWVVSLYQRGTASLKRINRILDAEPRISDPGNGDKPERKVTGKIEFRNLTFTYPVPDKFNGSQGPALKDINLTVTPGMRLGITGPTGSGKTTLVALIARLYPVENGMLFIDDLDINLWPLKKLRRAIGYVPQETFLFSDTITNNINFSFSENARFDVTEAARLAALHDDVEGFPNRYETILGERGITLSGGQKQRTALARAFIKEPAIIILDDATSSVDTETESKIFSSLNEVLPGRTSLVISHRVASLKDCDRIIYLEDGTIIEEGSHEQLIARNGAYAALYRRQLMEQALESM